MTADAFRLALHEKLVRNEGRVLLRVALNGIAAEPIELTGLQILQRAQDLAGQYAPDSASGVVLLLLPHSLELFLLHLGLVLRGAVPAILAWPTSRMDPEKYQRNLVHQLSNLPAKQLITLPAIAANLASRVPFCVTECVIDGTEQFERNFRTQTVINDGSRASQAKPALPPDTLFLQFTGGTTGAQKCVVVTAQTLLAQLIRLNSVLNLSEEDCVVSWLPLYHDMGLIACLWFPLWEQAPSVQFAVSDWLLKPDLLFHYMERYMGTFCWLPNFAFSYMAAQKPRFRRQYALHQVKAWVSCSEPVRWSSINKFVDAFADWGVTFAAMQASYAMAENVFAVSQTTPGSPRQVVSRSQISWNSAGDKAVFRLEDDVYVSSGRLLPDMQIRIRSESGTLCRESEPGNIELMTPCLFSGYWGSDGYIKRSISDDGWYSTGDFGFWMKNEIFVIGRVKDMIIVGGQNIFPEDVEAIVNSVPGVYPGRAVAFGIADEQYGTESLVIVAELKGDFIEMEAKRLVQHIKSAVLAGIGTAPRFVKVCPSRWIVKSTAGKISRNETKARFLDEQRSQTSIQYAGSST